MALIVTHTKVDAIPDDPAAAAAGKVLPSDWNAIHTISGNLSDFVANPTGTVGLTAVNGSATTAMRSDGAPALDVTISPTWTGQHSWTKQLLEADGTAALPAYSFTNSPDTGFFLNSAGIIDVSYANSARTRFRASQIQVGSGVAICWSSAGTVGTADTFLNRGAAAALQLGAANAASPVAQTLQSQGSRAGTDSNVGGAALTVQSGTGTGTGAEAAIVFKTPIKVASGTGAQTQTTSLTLQSGVPILPTYAFASLPTGVVGMMAYVSDSSTATWGATIAGGGANKVLAWFNNANWTVIGA